MKSCKESLNTLVLIRNVQKQEKVECKHRKNYCFLTQDIPRISPIDLLAEDRSFVYEQGRGDTNLILVHWQERWNSSEQKGSGRWTWFV